MILLMILFVRWFQVNKAVLEGLLFVVGEDGLTLDQIEEVLEVDEEESKRLLKEIGNCMHLFHCH